MKILFALLATWLAGSVALKTDKRRKTQLLKPENDYHGLHDKHCIRLECRRVPHKKCIYKKYLFPVCKKKCSWKTNCGHGRHHYSSHGYHLKYGHKCRKVKVCKPKCHFKSKGVCWNEYRKVCGKVRRKCHDKHEHGVYGEHKEHRGHVPHFEGHSKLCHGKKCKNVPSEKCFWKQRRFCKPKCVLKKKCQSGGFWNHHTRCRNVKVCVPGCRLKKEWLCETKWKKHCWKVYKDCHE